MQLESAPRALPRRRTLAVSPEGFRRIALVATVALVLIVATGATVRLTGSGLGCEHWPGCQAGDPLPKKGYHSYVEFSNRIVAFLTVLATLVLAIAAWRVHGLARWVKVLATVVFVGTLGQAPLGALTVHYHLNPWLVISHLLLSLRRARPWHGRARRGHAARSRRRAAAAGARAGRWCGAARGRQRSRLLRHARDRRRAVSGELGRHARSSARLVPAVGRASRSRRGGVRDRLPGTCRVGVAQP